MDTAKARQIFEYCQTLSLQKKDNENLFRSLIALSELAYRRNDFVKGDRYYATIAELAKEINTPQSEADRLFTKGYGLGNKLELDSSLLYYDQSLRILDTISKDGYIWGLINKAGVLVSKGEFKNLKLIPSFAANCPECPTRRGGFAGAFLCDPSNHE
jgi:hypothetical protein